MAKTAKVAKKRRGRPPGSGKKIADAIPTAAESSKLLHGIKEALQHSSKVNGGDEGPYSTWQKEAQARNKNGNGESVWQNMPEIDDRPNPNSLNVEMKRSRNAQDEAICRALHEQAEANRKLAQALRQIARNVR